MTHRPLGGAKAINVILSEAKNLVHIRGVARMPRSFATLRMTTVGRSVRKSTLPYEGGEVLDWRVSNFPLALSLVRRGFIGPTHQRRADKVLSANGYLLDDMKLLRFTPGRPHLLSGRLEACPELRRRGRCLVFIDTPHGR